MQRANVSAINRLIATKIRNISENPTLAHTLRDRCVANSEVMPVTSKLQAIQAALLEGVTFVAASKFDPARAVLVAIIRDNHDPC